MSQKIIVPRESFGGVIAVSEFAKKDVFFFPGAVAGRHVAINVSSPVELPTTCPNRAGEVSAMGLNMFANRTAVSVLRVVITNVKVVVRTGAHVFGRIAWGTLDKRSDLGGFERKVRESVFLDLVH